MMLLHPSTFEYLKPTEAQLKDMELARGMFTTFARNLAELLPDGPDKTYITRGLRTLAMWSFVAITREADGTPRAP